MLINMIIAIIADIIPWKIEFNKKGFLIKLFLAPTSCMVRTKNRLEKMDKRMVLFINITAIATNRPQRIKK